MPAFHLTPLLLAALTGTMAMMAYVALIGPLVRQLGVNEMVAGISMSVAGVFWMLLARPWGRASDRLGRKPVLLAGLGVFTLAYALLALFVDVALHHSLPPLLIAFTLIGARTVIGAFYAAVPPTVTATIADHVAPQARQQTMAKLGSANAVGMVAGPAIISFVSGWGLHWGLYATSALPLIGLLAIALGLPAAAPVARAAPPHPDEKAQTESGQASHEKPAEKPAEKPTGKATVSLFDARLRLPMTIAFVSMITIAVAQVSVGFFAMDRFGLSQQEGARLAGNALTSVGLALIVSQQCVIRLKGIALHHWVIGGAIICAIGFAGGTAFTQTWGLLLGYGVGAFGMGFIFPSFQAMAANAVQAHEQGAAAGNVSAAQGLGMVLGPMLGTALYTLGPTTPYVAIAVMLLALAAAVALSRTGRP